ncbi:hypothetical protein Cgig2_001754 [Carnegiea gigantea]|uniref:Uncharacterized protein n=1 Tax=Carnegiea gigantea TaxID=171969 RepID=A0A9Q1K9K4_9CARY|nr:hypothetical protein Cgig2_001754 [Carnegiea gigantea]
MEAHRQEASSDSDEEESSRSNGQTPIPSDDSEEDVERDSACDSNQSSERSKRWLTMYGKPSDDIGGVPHALRVHSWRTTGSYGEEAAHDFELPEMVQATFYAMLINDAIGLGIVSGFIAANLKASLEGLHGRLLSLGCTSIGAAFWRHSFANGLPRGGERERERREMIIFPNFTSTEQATEYVRDTFRWPLRESSALHPNPLLEDYHGLCPGFDLGMATVRPRLQHSEDGACALLCDGFERCCVAGTRELTFDGLHDVGYAEAGLGTHRILARRH